MEVTGLVLSIVSTVGVIGQLLDGCLKAYRIFTTATHLGRDSERLLCKIKIEEMRLYIWGRAWSGHPGGLDPALAADAPLRSLAELILTQLHATVTDLAALQGKYGLAPGASDGGDAAGYAATLAAGRHAGGLRLRARWVVADRERFAAFLDDLAFYNDRLERLFPPAGAGGLQRAWTDELLVRAGADGSRLEVLKDAAGEKYPRLGAFAELKQLRVNLDARHDGAAVLSSSRLKVKPERLRLVARAPRADGGGGAGEGGGGLGRQRATLDGDGGPPVDVLVEWTPVPPALDAEARVHAYQRVDNLARLLARASNRHPDLHTLDCAGYVDEVKERARYGLLYVLPTSTSASQAGHGGSNGHGEGDGDEGTPTSLDALIASDAGTPPLDARFALARTLAVALWACHALDWLHKSLCPGNVLVFAGDVRRAYLAGFEGSRPDQLDEMSAAPPAQGVRGAAVYRHPASLGVHRRTYCKAFDVYSLGLVLLEVGLWRGLDAVVARAKGGRWGAAAFREKVIQGLVPALAAKTGTTYCDVVRRCLEYEGEDEGKAGLSAHGMMESVVAALDGLKV